MRMRFRLSLLIILLIFLPAIPASLVTRQLINHSLDLALNPQVDTALAAGVRRAREQLDLLRGILSSELIALSAGLPSDGEPDPALIRQALAASALTPADRLVLRRGSGEEQLIQDAEMPHPDPETSVAGPPTIIEATVDLAPNWQLAAQRPLPAAWRDDAQTLASTHQVIRGLQTQRSELEKGFWLPFLAIYGLAIVLGFIIATHMARGITTPIERLLTATEALTAGRWDTRVPVTSGDEIGRLLGRFNRMVGTLDAQNRHLIELEKMAGWREMARALAHEVKNPLTPIQLTVEEIRVRYKGDDGEYKQLLDECTRIIIEEVKSLRNVVTRFREFSRPVEPEMGPVGLNGLLRDIAAIQKDMQVELELDKGIGEIVADADRLRQVLRNLAQNARVATADQPVAKLLLASRLKSGWIQIRVEDNGPGIPLGERERVFEPYRSGTAGGLGLGLALVKGIVLAHKGKISAGEGKWGGASIKITIPHTTVQGGGETVLLDEPITGEQG